MSLFGAEEPAQQAVGSEVGSVSSRRRAQARRAGDAHAACTARPVRVCPAAAPGGASPRVLGAPGRLRRRLAVGARRSCEANAAGHRDFARALCWLPTARHRRAAQRRLGQARAFSNAVQRDRDGKSIAAWDHALPDFFGGWGGRCVECFAAAAMGL